MPAAHSILRVVVFCRPPCCWILLTCRSSCHSLGSYCSIYGPTRNTSEARYGIMQRAPSRIPSKSSGRWCGCTWLRALGETRPFLCTERSRVTRVRSETTCLRLRGSLRVSLFQVRSSARSFIPSELVARALRSDRVGESQ